MRRRTVLFIYGGHQKTCGVASAIAALARGLAILEWNVVVGVAWGYRYHDPETFVQNYPDINVVRMDARTGSEEGRVQAVVDTILQVRPDVVVHTLLDSAFEACRRVKNAGANFSFIAANREGLPYQVTRILENRDVVDHITSNNKLVYDLLRGTNSFGPEYVSYIPNGVEIPKTAGPARRELEPFTTRLGYCGRLGADKKFGDFLDIVESLSKETSIEAWVAGDGPLRTGLRERQNDCPDRIKYFGHLGHRALYRDFYPNVDIGVHTSSSEGWSSSVAEMMAFGIPLVSSTYMGVFAQQLIRHEHNAYLYETGNVAAAVGLVRRLIENPSSAESVGRNARMEIEEYSVDRMCQKWSTTMEALRSEIGEYVSPSRLFSVTKGLRGKEGLREMYRRNAKRRFPHKAGRAEWPQYRVSDWTKCVELAHEMVALEEGAEVESQNRELKNDLVRKRFIEDVEKKAEKHVERLKNRTLARIRIKEKDGMDKSW